MFYNYNVGKLAVSIHRAESSSQLWTWDAFLYLACMYIQRVQRLNLSLVSIYSIKAHQLQGKISGCRAPRFKENHNPVEYRSRGERIIQVFCRVSCLFVNVRCH